MRGKGTRPTADRALPRLSGHRGFSPTRDGSGLPGFFSKYRYQNRFQTGKFSSGMVLPGFFVGFISIKQKNGGYFYPTFLNGAYF
jgi:hypothetical protein